MPKRKNLVKSNDSNKSKKKVYNYQKKNFAILKLKKKTKSKGASSRKTNNSKKNIKKEIDNKSSNIPIINTKNEEEKLDSNNSFENKLLELKEKKNKSETLLKENIINKEEINSLKNEINYIIYDKEIIFKYKNIISDEIDYLFNKQKDDKKEFNKIENKEKKDKTAEKNLNNLYQEISNITKEIVPKKKKD